MFINSLIQGFCFAQILGALYKHPLPFFSLMKKNQKIKAAQLLPKKASPRREINELGANAAPIVYFKVLGRYSLPLVGRIQRFFPFGYA